MKRAWMRPLLLFAALVFVSGCRDITLKSSRLVRPIPFSGASADWDSIPGLDFEKEKFSLAAANDDETLYLFIATFNRSLAMEAMRLGFRLRFQPEESKNEVLWIGSPGSVRPGAPVEAKEDGNRGDDPRNAGEEYGGGHRGMGGGRGGYHGMGDAGYNTDDRLEAAFADLRNEVRIFTPAGVDSLDLTTEEAAAKGIDMKPGYEKGGHFLLEIKVPLRRDAAHPLAVGAGPKTQNLELNIRIPKPEWHGRGFEGRRPEGPGDDDFDQGTYPGGEFGMGGGMSRPPMIGFEGLDVNVKIVLARNSMTASS